MSGMRHFQVTRTIFFISLIAVGIAYAMRDSIVDDAFIYLRVAENLSEGRGWSYNDGDNDNPCTSQLYTLFLALLLSVGLSGKAALLLSYAIQIASGGLLLLALFHKTDQTFAIASIVVWCTSSTLLTACGLETGFLIVGCMVAIWCYQNAHWGWLGLSLGILPLIRPDGILMLPLLLPFLYFKHRKYWKTPLLIAGLLLVCWATFSYVAFGNVIPNSVLIKANQSQLEWLKGRSYFGEFLSLPIFPLMAWTLVICGALALFYYRSQETTKSLILLVLFGLFQLCVYSLASAPTGYPWYHFPCLISLNLMAAFGFLAVVRLFKCALFDGKSGLHFSQESDFYRVYLGITAGLFISTLGVDSIEYIGFQYRLGPEYKEVSSWLNEQAPRHKKIAATEIGYLGYYSKLQILDIHGLIHRNSREALTLSESWWFEESLPDFIVVHSPPWFGEPSSRWSDALQKKFEDNYHIVKEVNTVSVYALKGSAHRIGNISS